MSVLKRRILTHPGEVSAAEWDALLAAQPGGGACGPFLRHANLLALHTSGCATAATGWAPHWVTLWAQGQLAAAAPLYIKSHPYGEYVFDWAWANAHHQHGLPYYPKGVVAIPFTPVPGPRLLARDAATRRLLAQALVEEAQALGLSSLHILFATEADHAATVGAAQPGAAGAPATAVANRSSPLWMARQTVQFHWANARPKSGERYQNFEDFLAHLSQDKRKKIRAEQRKVREAGVRFEWARGADISAEDWAFFVRCYQQTYAEHGNPPYLNPAYFAAVSQHLAGHWLLFKALDAHGEPMAASLIALSDEGPTPAAAYGRYWGALRRVDCLHFDACYHQPLAWCIAHGVGRFEGGAQGEHKLARALLPVPTQSLHWLAHPAFAQAISQHLVREHAGVDRYLEELARHTPFRQVPVK